MKTSLKKFIVGLTGGIGSGKTAVSDYLHQQGICIVDADIVARIIVEPGKPAWQDIKEHFGDEVLLEDQTLNRSWLRQQVFANPEQRKTLERFTHPRIRDEIIRQLQASDSPYTILVSPLLIESGQYQLVERIVVVDVPEEVQINRTCSRDTNDAEQVKRIIAAQISRKDRLAKADDVIDNSGDLAGLQNQAAELHQQLLKRAKAK